MLVGARAPRPHPPIPETGQRRLERAPPSPNDVFWSQSLRPLERLWMFLGKPVSPGVARGKACIRLNRINRIAAPKVPEKEIPGEIARFHAALSESEGQLRQIREDLERDGTASRTDLEVFEVHIACLRDPVFIA